MTRERTLVAVCLAIGIAASFHALVGAQNIQGIVGQNVSVVGGIKDQFIGDMFRQKQNEVVSCTFAVNPNQQMFAYNDYRTVDAAQDMQIGTPSTIQRSFFTKLFTPFRKPRIAVSDPDHASALAWIGLSFTDNGTNFYTGLHPGSPFSPSIPAAEALENAGFQAASDPVFAATPSHCLLAGIAFTPGGLSAGFVSRFTSRNNNERTPNVVFDWSKVLYRSPANSLAQASDFFVDKPYIACGANGRCVVGFVVFDESDPTKVSSKVITFTSSNHGDTWSTTPVVVSQPLSRNQSPWILIDPNNENIVYIGWRVFANPKYPNLTNAIVGKKSTNGGASFDPIVPYPVALLLRAYDAPQTVYPFQPITPRSNAYPTAVIDSHGTISVFVQEYVDGNGYPLGPLQPLTNGKARITQTSSNNGGLSWTARRAFDYGPNSGPQFMPSAAVTGVPGPVCSGKPGPRSRVAVMYYDARPSYPGGAVFLGGGGARFDVRVAQADPCVPDSGGRLAFGPSQAVSRYTLDGTPQHNIVTTAGFGYPAVNAAYRMFNATQSFFTGDYISVAAKIGFVLSGGVWKSTTAASVNPADLPSPVWKGTFADTRDLTLPSQPAANGIPFTAGFIDGLPWEVYAPPHSGLPVPACSNPASRDQNPYMAEISDGLYAAAPVTFRDSTAPRAYPLYVENRTGLKRFFRVSVDPNPALLAGFNVPPATGPYVPEKTSDVAIGSFSTVTGSVIAAAGLTDPVKITVREITGLVNPAFVANGLSTVVVINTSQATAGGDTETRDPALDPAPILSKPFGTVPPEGITIGPNGPDPYVNPFGSNPFGSNPFGSNPFGSNPFGSNPFGSNTAVYDVTDVTFVASSVGTKTASYSAILNIAGFDNLTVSDYKFQAFINRPSAVPRVDGCQTIELQQPIQVSNLKTPFGSNPFGSNPFGSNPFGSNPFGSNPFGSNAAANDENVSNSSFYLAPPSADAPNFRDKRPDDRNLYTLRVFQLKPTAALTTHFTPDTVTVIVQPHEPNIVPTPGGGFDFERAPDGTPVVHPAAAGAQVPTQLVFTTQPATAQAGTAISPAIVVTVKDVFNNVVPGFGGPVTLAIGNNPSGGALSGTTTQNAVNGVATFAGLSIDKAGANYTLVASAGLTSAFQSTAFDVTAPPPPAVLSVLDTDVLSFGRGSMRGNGTGTIEVTGVSGSVKQALLYWNGPTNSSSPTANAAVRFAGHPVVGANSGFAASNCWAGGFTNSQSYRADVTPLVTGNGTYALADFAKITGQSLVDINGVSLVVFFDDGNPANNRDAYILNTNDSNEASDFDPANWNQTMSGISYQSGTAVLQVHVADGQGYGDGGITLTNGEIATQILPAGPNFQGNTVPPDVGRQILTDVDGGLWDIRSFDIPTGVLGSGLNTVALTSPSGSDCMSLVVMLVSVPHTGTLQFGSVNIASTTFPRVSSSAGFVPISGTVVNGTGQAQSNLFIQSLITQGNSTVGAAGAILSTTGNSDGTVPTGTSPLSTGAHEANASQTTGTNFVDGPATLTIELVQFESVVDSRTFAITLVSPSPPMEPTALNAGRSWPRSPR